MRGEVDDQVRRPGDLLKLLVSIFCGGAEVAAVIEVGDEEAADAQKPSGRARFIRHVLPRPTADAAG
jgi:hypothetical protein